MAEACGAEAMIRRARDAVRMPAFRQAFRILPVLTLVLGAMLALGSGEVRARGWGKDYVPNLPVVTQDGKTLNFYDDLIKDKIFVINFLFTSCRDICPLAAARLSVLQEKLGDRVGRDIFIYSLSIDPENDTPDKLKKYAETFGAGPGWLFLTGIPEDLKEIRYKLGERSRTLNEHRNEVLLGNGATGEWQRDSVMGDLDRLIMAIQAMNPAWSTDGAGMVHTTQTLEAYQLTGPAGEMLFRKACAGCHTIGSGDRVGPDLAGITERRQHDWLTSFIADPGKMRAKKDPIALALTAKYPVVRMPALGVSESEAADLIAYIDQKSVRPKVNLEPLLALTTHQGKHLTAQDLKGRPLAVAFGFTHCPDVCPTTLLNWTNVLSSLGPDGDKINVLFVSVDSERDTPELLNTYMQSFDPRITALTGSPEAIAEVAKVFDAYYEKIEGDAGEVVFDHTVKTYLVDERGQSAGTADLHTDEVKRDSIIKKLLAH